jgi:hypothetical protein
VRLEELQEVCSVLSLKKVKFKKIHAVRWLSLSLKKLKFKEIHAVRWLSLFEAIEIVLRTLSALFRYFGECANKVRKL